VAQQRLAADHLLLLDTGDALIGDGLLANSTMGQVIIDGMNLMGYDAMALGPRELSLGPVLLRQRLREAAFPILSANVQWSDSGQLVTQPYVILDIKGHRIAVVGLTRVPDQNVDGMQVLAPEEVLSQIVDETASQADTIILLTNLPFRPALELVEEVQHVDLLIAALPRQLPDRAVQSSNPGTLAVTAEQPLPKHTGRRVGKLDVTLASDGSLINQVWVSVPMGPGIADDPLMAAVLDEYR
jgi:2',3'-cyclic-nucleotide 2'-phosphodiesterase (5'-nucleotidase family)